jgi:hypothetical protein
MQTRVIAVPRYDLGQSIVDQSVGDPLTVVWQVPLSGFHTRDTRLDSVAGVAVLISPASGVLTPGAAPPDFDSDLWPVPVRVAGSASSGQMMVVDQSSMVYRLTPGRTPVPVWRADHHPDEVDVVGLPGGRLLSSSFDDSWAQTQLVDEVSGRIVWTSPLSLAPTLVVGERLIGSGFGPVTGLMSLNTGTGEQQWRHDEPWQRPDLVAVVGDMLWSTDSIRNELVAFDVQSGMSSATVTLPHRSRLTGVLDQEGHLHIIDEQGWTTVDLTSASVVSDARFDIPGIGNLFANRAVRVADGRLVLADDRGQVFVVYPDRPGKPELVATCPQIQGIGTAAGRVIVMSYDGTLTALGAPS